MAVWPSGFDGEAELDEMDELLRTARVAGVGRIVQHRLRPHPRTYLGPGKLEELQALAHQVDAEVVVCDDELTPRAAARARGHARDARSSTAPPVILDIFAAHAHTAEGKLQVELAQLEYSLPRMRGMWKHLERLGGGVGTRGPGESQLETDRRLARNRIPLLRRGCDGIAAPAHGAQAARGLRDAVGVARRVHERRQVDAAEHAHRRRGVVGRPAVRDARPDHPRLRVRRPRVHAHRHRRLHPQAAARPRRGVRVDAGGDDRGRPDHPRRRRVGRRGGAAGPAARRRGGAGRDRRGGDRRACWC